MIIEDRISIDIAKLLNEKGFNEDTTCVYVGRFLLVKGEGSISNTTDLPSIPAPTHQMVMKWLRQVHNIFIQIELYSKNNDYCFELFLNTHRLMKKCETYNSFEQACEASILFCLENLI